MTSARINKQKQSKPTRFESVRGSANPISEKDKLERIVNTFLKGTKEKDDDQRLWEAYLMVASKASPRDEDIPKKSLKAAHGLLGYFNKYKGGK